MSEAPPIHGPPASDRKKKKTNDLWATLMRVGGSAHAQGSETSSSVFHSLRPERRGCVRCHLRSWSRDQILNLSGFAESVFPEGQAMVINLTWAPAGVCGEMCGQRDTWGIRTTDIWGLHPDLSRDPCCALLFLGTSHTCFLTVAPTCWG